MKEYPLISVVTPSIRKENLNRYLNNIRNQDYPEDKLEIVVAWGLEERIDDLERKYKCHVIYNSVDDMEVRRRVAIEGASGEWIFMADDDNYFENPSLIRNMIEAVINEGAYAAECVWQSYKKEDYLINRYCALVGAYDPSVLYLNRQDHLGVHKMKWCLQGSVLKENNKYFFVEFKPSEIPTMGDQGFLIRKKDMLLGVNGQAIMHMDVCMELAQQGKGKFIFMKDYYGHDCVQNKKQLLGKLKRNIDRFQVDGMDRKMNYDMSIGKMIKLGLILGTFVIPLKDSLIGYHCIKDKAWFVHPILCFQVAVMYTISTIKGRILRK